MDIVEIITRELGIKKTQTEAVIKLIDEDTDFQLREK